LIASLAFAAWLYLGTLSIGFLLDDFYHLDYLISAFNGHPEALTKLLWSNWSPDTTLTSYRPLVSFSLAGDFALWGINAIGYHATNLLLFGGCITFVALIAQELCLAFELSNGAWVAIGAAFLFAAYPLHPEAVAWIIGRVDVLCGLLTFASAYCYLVHRRSSRGGFLIAAVLTFILAMMCKEMAVTLPLILTLLEWCAPTVAKRRRRLIWMWGALAVFAVWRTAILGTVVGGYGGTGWKTFKQGLKNFADNATLAKLFFGANEEFLVSPHVRTALWGSVLVIDICGIVLLKLKPNVWRLYLFLLGWTVFTVLPTFQIWHIWPNLVGSRLFFIGSAPLCIALAVAAIATMGSARWDRYRSAIGGAAIALLVILWSILLESNLVAWKGASQRLQAFRIELQSYFPKLSENFKMFIPFLPQDYKGAPILGRPEYLSVLCKPPFADKDYTDYLLTAEPIIAGGMELVGPQAFAAASHQSKKVMFWDTTDPVLGRISDTTIASPLIGISPSNPLTLKDRYEWLHRPSVARPILAYDAAVVPLADHARIYISKAWQPFTNAPRPVPPEKQFIEREVGPVPLRSQALLPRTSPGVHDVTVMAFDKDDKPVGIMSETVSIISRSGDQKR
jgi:hypothetical protein